MNDTEFIVEKTWKDTPFFEFCRRYAKRKMAVIGFVILFLLVLAAVLAPLLTTYGYNDVDVTIAYLTPNKEHLFGTDSLGRDLYTRILYGGRYSLSISVLSELMGLVFALVLGSIAGYYGGKIDNLILRFCDILQSLPSILLCICVSQVLGSGIFPTMIALGITGIASVTRMLRASMLNVREQEFVKAAQAINCKKPVIIFKHVVPNCLAPVIVACTGGIGNKIISSASLSYLGLGIQEPLPEWGALISAGKAHFRYHPHLIVIPGIVIAITVLSYNLIGDGIRDALDPKLK
ncbi:MAG: ABC transporter permease [Lachnospiraceae bacterium]